MPKLGTKVDPLIGDRFVHITYFVFVSENVGRVFSTPVISSVRIINLLLFCLGRRRPLCMFLPISILEGRFVHIIFLWIVFALSELVAQDVFFYPLSPLIGGGFIRMFCIGIIFVLSAVVVWDVFFFLCHL